MGSEALHQMQARHRRDLRELQGRITSKKKNATKKTRKGVNDECAEMERLLREKQAGEMAALNGQDDAVHEPSTPRSDQDDDELAEATSKLDVGSSAESEGEQQQQPPPPPPPHQEGMKKKRNRARERLARRAAEQEDAARMAEDEASRMTDHRAREGEYMRKVLSAHGLVEKEIEPDGHCLFSAVADQLVANGVPLEDGEGEGTGGADVSPYRVVRRTAAAFMRENREDFEPFVEGELESYVERIRDTAEWGGELELTAVARRYGVEIRVVQDGRMESIGEEGGKVLWLAYYRHGYGLGEHYNSLRKK
ncbi:hypothetical protein EsDP_00006188 [Epichloe bromicola]|uniref:OTU domain-containing protein n=1 Tax=Epichloe bromicola TaxID=79588 RepID=A0ABQ0CWV3_9HYPO